MGKQQRKVKVRELRLLFTLTLVGLFLSGCGGSVGEEGASASSPPSAISAPNPTDSTAQLEKLTLTAFPIKNKGTSELTLIIGNEQPFLAVGEYSNGQSKVLTEELSLNDWQSSDGELGEFIQSGVLKAKAQGEITVSFSHDNLTSNSVDVNVTEAEITDILVTPSVVSVAKGHSEVLTATATYNNGLSVDISESVTWTSSEPSIAVVNSQNSDSMLTGVDVGSATITATQNDIVSNKINADVTDAVVTAISVTPERVTVAKGQSEPLTATAFFSDDSLSNLTDSVTWETADSNTVTVSSNGLLSGKNIGTTNVTATIDGVTSNGANVVVSDAVVTNIRITPLKVTVARGLSQQLTAIADYSDGTSSDISRSVTWIPVNTNTATLTPEGQVIGGRVGTTTVTATKDGVTSNTIEVDVTGAVITTIDVTPETLSIAKGLKQPLTAIATFSDDTSLDVSDSVTWVPIDTSTVSVTPEGQVTGVEVGVTTINAVKDQVTSNSVDVEVTNKIITDLTFSPKAVGLMVNNTQLMKTTAHYSDGSSSNVSGSVTWQAPENSNIASLTANGLVTGRREGNTKITADLDGFTESVEVNVCRGDGTNVTGKCIYILNVGHGVYYTSTPSVAYLNSVGLGGSGHTSGTKGMFYTFDHSKAMDLCSKYSDMSLHGRTNWNLPSIHLLRGLYENEFPKRWNNTNRYWSSSASPSKDRPHVRAAHFYDKQYEKAKWGYYEKDLSFFASCVSFP